MTLFQRQPPQVRALAGAGERSLAWAQTSAEGWILATDDRLCCTAPEFDHRWVEILGASWAPPRLEIKLWQPTGPQEREILIDDAGVLPQVIRERIMQSCWCSSMSRCRESRVCGSWHGGIRRPMR